MTPLQILAGPVTRAELVRLAELGFGDMVKAVVDVRRAGIAMIEFDSLINVRPSQGNRSRDVEDEAVREAIRGIVGR